MKRVSLVNSLNNKSTSVLPTFDYSTLSSEEKLKTLENEKRLDDIFNRYEPEVGEVLYNQQQVMANHGNGMFQNWYESKGFNRGKVYQYINNYKFLNNIEELSHRDIFVSAPKSLQNEMSKPSANPEVNEKVFNGDITTHKDYKEQERLIKQKDVQLKQKDQEIERLKNKPPEVVEREVIPEDYQFVKSENEHLSNELEKLQEDNRRTNEQLTKWMRERKSVDEQSEKYEQLSKAISNAEEKLSGKQKLISNYHNLSELLRKSNDFLSVASSILYQDLSEVTTRDSLAKQELGFLVERTERFLDDLKKLMDEQSIIEGEIIYE